MVDLPFISFIVLTLNNKNTIGQCIESIVSQRYPSFEVLVIDGGSTDGTKKIVEGYAESNVSLHEFPGYSIGKSRQIGVGISKGKMCAFIDSDCELPDTYWTRKMVDPFLKHDKVGGTWVLGSYKKEYPSIARYSILHHPYRRMKIPEVVGQNNYIPIGTGHTLISKDAILEVGGFSDLKSKEDVDLTFKIVKAGYNIVHVQDCDVYHLHATNLKAFLNKYRRDINVTLSDNQDDTGGGSSSISFLLTHLLLYPIALALFGMVKDRDLAWLWHPVICSAKCVIVAKSFLNLKVLNSR